MRHAVLGAGAVGGLLSAAFARAGVDIVVLMRAESLAEYSGRFAVESQVLGDFEVAVRATAVLDRDVDVLWVTPKATQLGSAMTLASPERVGDATVIPLMNGVDHLDVLRARYRRVAAGAMRVASNRTGVGRISQTSPFIRIDVAAADEVADDVRSAGIDCRISDDELSLLWQKLVFLCPLALATTAADAPLGSVRRTSAYLQMQTEALTVAAAAGAHIDLAALEALREAAPDSMHSSMQHDVRRGLTPEIDAIAGPILRIAHRKGIDVPATQLAADQVIVRAGLTPDAILLDQS